MNFNEKIEKCLAFIRYAIDPERHKAPEMSENDWLRLFHFASKQAVLGIIFEGVSYYQAQGIAPPRNVILKWLSRTVSLKRKNAATNKAVAKLIELLEMDGFKCCILKGQGNNLLYPNVYSRTPGDIDVWVAKEGDTKSNVRDIIKYVRQHNPKGRAVYHHIDYGFFDKTEVEIHYRPSFMNNPLYNHRIQQWFIQQADAQFANRVELPDEVGAIPVPTPEFNAVYQLAHIYTHILNLGISLKQIIDYYYVLLALKDKQELEHTLHYLGLEKIAGAMMWVLTNMLGLKEKYQIVAPDERLGRVLAAELLITRRSGRHGSGHHNMSHDPKMPLWKLWINKNLQRLYIDMRMVSFFPSECLCEPLFRLYHFFWRCPFILKAKL